MSTETAWQPIETAPTDGTAILAANPEKFQLGIVVRLGSEWEAVNFNFFGLGLGFYPTFWMPLPGLPVQP